MRDAFSKTIIVTGGSGFIGSHFVRAALAQGYFVVTLDALTYAASRATLSDLDREPHHKFIHGSISDRSLVDALLAEHEPFAIVNFAAATHVDRSIEDPRACLETNVCGVFELLEAARHYYDGLDAESQQRFRFLQVSTDEVFGSIPSGHATIDYPHRPSSPYSATKAGADDLVQAWAVTYGLPTLISHCTNNYGPYQFPEKLIPHMIIRALSDMSLPVYGDGLHRRDWLYVGDHIDGLLGVLRKGIPGRRYNLASGTEHTNLKIVETICAALDQLMPRADGRHYVDLVAFVRERPGHDRRYGLDITATANEIGFAPKISLEAGLVDTVKWYFDHSDWWRPLLQGGYSLQHFDAQTMLEPPCDAV